VYFVYDFIINIFKIKKVIILLNYLHHLCCVTHTGFLNTFIVDPFHLFSAEIVFNL